MELRRAASDLIALAHDVLQALMGPFVGHGPRHIHSDNGLEFAATPAITPTKIKRLGAAILEDLANNNAPVAWPICRCSSTKLLLRRTKASGAGPLSGSQK